MKKILSSLNIRGIAAPVLRHWFAMTGGGQDCHTRKEDWFAMTREGAAALLALRAACGGCALYTPAGVVVRF